MTIEQLREIALQHAGVTEDIKWEDHLCFSVSTKMFLVTAPDMLPISASFRVHTHVFYEVIAREGFQKHKYLGRHHWVQLDNINRLPKKEWEEYIYQTYHLVASKLSLKTKKDLGLY